MSQNTRFETARAIKVDGYNDTASLKNVLEFAQALHNLFIEIHEENWLVVTADNLASACLEKIVITKGLSIDELIAFYGKATTSSVRMSAMNFWRGTIANLNKPAELLDLARFFNFALADSNGKEDYVIGTAHACVDSVYQKLLTVVDPTLADAKTYLHAISNTQPVFDFVVGINQRINGTQGPPLTKDQLGYLISLLGVVIDESGKRSADILMQAKLGLAASNLKLVLSSATSIDEKKIYFHALEAQESRNQALLGLAKTAAGITSKAELTALRGFFYFASDDSSKFEAWLPLMAHATAESISARLLLDYELTPDEAAAAFHEMRSDNTYDVTLAALAKRVDTTAASDPQLPRLSRLFEIAIEQAATGHADWIAGKGKIALDAVSKKLTMAKDATTETRMTYFHKIRSPDARAEVLGALVKQMNDTQDRAQIMEYNRFFNFAVVDSAAFEAWVPQAARIAIDAISVRLFASYDLSLAEMKRLFHQITVDDTRSKLLFDLRKKIATLTGLSQIADMNELFNFAMSDSASRPPWVSAVAAAGIDECSSAALTKFDLSDEDAHKYLGQMQTDQAASSTLRALVKKMEKNRNSYPVLLQVRKLFEIAIQETGNHADWVRATAFQALENASARIIKKPVIDGDEMIRLFGTLQTEQLRADVLNYWRGKIGHSYADKASLLALARFFNAAEEDTTRKGNVDWVIATATSGVTEVTAKIIALFPVFEGVFDITPTCQDNKCATGFLDTMVIMNTLSSDALQITFMHGDTGTPAFAFASVATSKGATTFDAVLDTSGLAKMHLIYDAATGGVQGFIENSDRLGVIQITGQQRRSPVDVYDSQTTRMADESLLFPKKLPQIQAKGMFDDMPATLTVRSLTANDETVFAGLLKFDGYPRLKVSFQRGSYDANTGMLVLVSTQASGARMKLVLATKFDPITGEASLSAAKGAAHVSLTGTSFSTANQIFHDMQFSQ